MIVCDECQVGRLRSSRATFLQPLPGGSVLIFPLAPALTCDACGTIEYDAIFTGLIDALIMGEWQDSERDQSRRGLLGRYPGSTVPRNKMM